MNRRRFLGRIIGGLGAAVVFPSVVHKSPVYYPLVDGANQDGSLLATEGWEPGTRLEVGDVFAIAGVTSVHPLAGEPLAGPKLFVVTASMVADDDGRATLPIAPAIVPAGLYQNVSNAPYNRALLESQHGWGVPAKELMVTWA